ncbi:MAG TPA: GNAT family N-acetyltransferase [Candidatus Saccharimonadales bacterium]|nr:GNAT family N-acetyltransferase [Candidatus Saccharimonadales bacterium]
MAEQRFTITSPSLAEVEELNAMWTQSWLDTYPNEEFGVPYEWVSEKISRQTTPEGIEKRKKQIQAAAGNPDVLWRIAKDKSGKIIGVAAPHRDENVQRLGALYVDKKYHGSGVAQALMKEILAWADPTRPIELEVATYNERAKAFYKKYGFEEVSGSEHLVHDKIPVVRMIRKGDKQ